MSSGFNPGGPRRSAGALHIECVLNRRAMRGHNLEFKHRLDLAKQAFGIPPLARAPGHVMEGDMLVMDKLTPAIRLGSHTGTPRAGGPDGRAW